MDSKVTCEKLPHLRALKTISWKGIDQIQAYSLDVCFSKVIDQNGLYNRPNTVRLHVDSNSRHELVRLFQRNCYAIRPREIASGLKHAIKGVAEALRHLQRIFKLAMHFAEAPQKQMKRL